MMFSDGHVLFAQLLSSLLQGRHTAPGSRHWGGGVGVWGCVCRGAGSEFSLPPSALPASTGTLAEPGKGPATFGFASAWAMQGGCEGEAGAQLASPHPAAPVFLLHLLFSLSGPWWGTGSQGWAEPHSSQEKGVLTPASSQGHGGTGKHCSQHCCSHEDGGVAAGSAAGLVTAQILL